MQAWAYAMQRFGLWHPPAGWDSWSQEDRDREGRRAASHLMQQSPEHAFWRLRPRIAEAVNVIPEKLITTEQLVSDTLSLVPRLPVLRAVIGVARSGILPASVLATHLGAELHSLDNRTGEILEMGRGRRFETQKPAGKVLLVDDSIYSGFAMRKAVEAVRKWNGEQPVTAAIYARPSTASCVDLVARLTERHWFAWNLFNHPLIEHWAFDLDGVLCRDFRAEEDDDGEQYLAAMRTMQGTANRPRKPVTIITARLERYRTPTLMWLESVGIPVEKLVMGPWKTKQEREASDVWQWKTEQIKALGKQAYVESSRHGAVRIHRATGMPVICTDTGEAFY